ncbi:hypothetical protein EAI_03012 [Harpegnathos saltator]|uniref:Uncharacterized protein n=1 Tax=Harpegnathos saltator TaxID=610380 RepID=E2BAH6_HARSA|nr:hypothetical protein EAI_03012 [Harpegnathos saltator]
MGAVSRSETDLSLLHATFDFDRRYTVDETLVYDDEFFAGFMMGFVSSFFMTCQRSECSASSTRSPIPPIPDVDSRLSTEGQSR